MDATTFRRYLQPSPTLRWHPWAPLVAGFLALAFAFWLGTQWGFGAAMRAQSLALGGGGFDVWARYERERNTPAHFLVSEAGRIDAAVARYNQRAQRPPPSVPARWRDELESQVFFHGRMHPADPAIEREGIVKIAEFRIAQLSAANPRWRATSAYCDEMRRYARAERDFLAEYRGVASAYATLLGRPILPEDLAPSVPGGKCAY